jgi:hypothetical protein
MAKTTKARASADISPQSIVLASKDQLSCDLGGEAAILNLATGVYWGLNEVGSFVWKMVEQPRRLSEICRAVVEVYDVDMERCERDVMALVRELAEAGLVEISDAPSGEDS